VPAAAVVAEAMVALVLADAVLDRFGGDSMTDLLARVAATGGKIRARLSRRPSPAQA
jgi:chorismate synthase